MNPKIIYQDDSLLVIDKPADLVVNTADSVTGNTVQDWVDSHFDYPLSHDKQLRNGLVHRLDKDTSGVMLLAKTIDALESLQAQFKNRTVKKTYLALVHGKLSPGRGTISLPLARSLHNRHIFTVAIGGKLSKTSYEVVQYFTNIKDKNLQTSSYQGFSLVSLEPHTGRTHQIRVVLKHLGHPLVGDSHYSGKKRAKADLKWCPRQFLHAKSIEFSHPHTGQVVSFEASLPLDLKSALGLLI